jgi:hypothetical protein
MTNTLMDNQVQKLQAMLYAKASQEPMTRFDRLYKQMLKPNWAWAAVQKVLSNKGSRTAGVDGMTRRDYSGEGQRQELVKSILDELGNLTYRPSPVRRVYIPKPNGKKRPLGIPTWHSHCTSHNRVGDFGYQVAEGKFLHNKCTTSQSGWSVSLPTALNGFAQSRDCFRS